MVRILALDFERSNNEADALDEADAVTGWMSEVGGACAIVMLSLNTAGGRPRVTREMGATLSQSPRCGS